MADADEIPHQKGHRRTAPSSGRSLLHGRLWVHQSPLLHDSLGEEGNLPVQEEETRQVEVAYEAELLLEAVIHPA